MKYLKLISAAVAMAVCVAAIYLLLGKREREIKKEYSEKYFIQNNVKTEDDIIKPRQIVEIHVVNPNGEFNFARDEDGEWLITQPVRTAADAITVESLARSLVFMTVDRVVEKNPEEPGKYGLDNPDIKIKYRLKDGGEWHRIYFGRRSPVEGSYYAMAPDEGEVVLVNYQYKFPFNGTLLEYRQRKLFPSFTTKLDSIKLDFKDKSYHFKWDYSYEFWRMEKPRKVIADKKKVNSVANILSGLNIADFVPPESVSEEMGFDDPSLVLTLELSDLGEEKLVIGDEVPGKAWLRYAKSNGHEGVFLVRGSIWFDEIPKILKETENKRALMFSPAGAREMIFRKNGKELKFVKKNRKKKWKIAGKEDLKLDAPLVRKTVRELYRYEIRGRTWIDATEANEAGFGFDDPSATIEINYREGAKRPDYRAVFGDEDPSGKYVYLYSTIDPMVRLVDKEIIQKIPVKAEHFIYR